MASSRCLCSFVKSLNYSVINNNVNVVNKAQVRFFSIKNFNRDCSLKEFRTRFVPFNFLSQQRHFSSSYFRPASEKGNTTSEKKSSFGLADELLAAKINADKGNEKSSSSDDSKKTDEAKEKEEQERAWRAMKFSFIVFGISFTGIGITMLYSWGKQIF